MENSFFGNQQDFQTLCGRCSSPFNGGIGKPFCAACERDMQTQNGWTDKDREEQAKQNLPPNMGPTTL